MVLSDGRRTTATGKSKDASMVPDAQLEGKERLEAVRRVSRVRRVSDVSDMSDGCRNALLQVPATLARRCFGEDSLSWADQT